MVLPLNNDIYYDYDQIALSGTQSVFACLCCAAVLFQRVTVIVTLRRRYVRTEEKKENDEYLEVFRSKSFDANSKGAFVIHGPQRHRTNRNDASSTIPSMGEHQARADTQTQKRNSKSLALATFPLSFQQSW